MRPVPEDLVVFLRGLEDELLLPALWLIRRSGLGAILRFYDPDEGAIETLNDRLFRENRELYEFVQERMKEN